MSCFHIILRVSVFNLQSLKKSWFVLNYTTKPDRKKQLYVGLTFNTKAKRRKYLQRPEVKARRNKRLKKYSQRPEVKARKRKYSKEYEQRPEVKAKRRKYQRKKKLR